MYGQQHRRHREAKEGGLVMNHYPDDPWAPGVRAIDCRIMPCPAKVHELRLRLLNNGYRPVPQEGKVPVLSGWPNEHTAEDIERWRRDRPDELNTGIAGAGVCIAADLDIRDEALCDRLETKLSDFIGRSDLCRIGQAPKRLFMYRVNEKFGKLKTGEFFPNSECRRDQKCQVEILANGQQFVVHGIHPDTNQPYRWSGPTPFDVKVDDLPLAKLDDIKAFLVEAEHVFRAGGYKTDEEWNPKAATTYTTTSSFGGDQAPIEVVEDAARYLTSRNDYDRDTWIKIGMAFKACGFQSLWEDFCLSYPDNTIREAQYRWKGLKPNGSVSPGTIIHMAREKGWQCPKRLITREEVRQRLDDLRTMLRKPQSAVPQIVRRIATFGRELGLPDATLITVCIADTMASRPGCERQKVEEIIRDGFSQ